MRAIVNAIILCAAVCLAMSAAQASPLVSAGEFVRIYDPSVGENEKWYINDHCFAYGPDGTWHLFGITREEPASPLDEDNFAHAVAATLTQQPWDKKPFALSVDYDTWRENHLWAPCVVRSKDTYYMFYCAGDDDNTRNKIHLATSKDLFNWKRHPKNPMVADGFDARDPYVLRVGDQWVMYYTATSAPSGGYHIVAYRTSKDLVTWSGRGVAFVYPQKGTFGGPTESPFVLRRGDSYYLFCGPQGGYRGTQVYHSKDPFHWNRRDEAGHIKSHAAEIIRDTDGKWYVSHCGWGQGGVYLAPLTWHDGLDDADSSLPVP